jgi:hypothetical protein
MLETGYKPQYELGGVWSGINAANADASAVQQLIKQAYENQVAPELHQETMDNKRAQAEWYRAQAEASARDKTDPLKAAKAKREMADMLLPDMATFVEPYMAAAKEKNGPAMGQTMPAMDAVLQRLRKVDPDSADIIERSYNPAQALVDYHQSRLEQTNPYVKMYGADRNKEGKVEAASIMAGAQNYRTSILEKIAALKAVAGAHVGKAASGFEMQGNKYFDMAVAEKDPEKKKAYTDQAQYFYNLALQKAEQAALARQAGTPAMPEGIPVKPGAPKVTTPPTGVAKPDPLGIRKN